MAYIKKFKVNDEEYDIHASQADEANTAAVAKKTQGTLSIGEHQFDGSQDISVDEYNGTYLG